MSATVVAVVSLVPYTNPTWFRKIPTTAAPKTNTMSRRRSRKDRSRTQVMPMKSSAAAEKRKPP